MKWNERYFQRWGKELTAETVTHWEREFAHAVGGRYVPPSESLQAVETLTHGKMPDLERIKEALCRGVDAKKAFKPSTMPQDGPERVPGCTYCHSAPGRVTWRPAIRTDAELTMSRFIAAYQLAIPCDCPAGHRFGSAVIDKGYFFYRVPGDFKSYRANWADALRDAKWQNTAPIAEDPVEVAI